MSRFVRWVDAVLRAPPGGAAPAGLLVRRWLTAVVAGGMAYGAVMGTFGGVSAQVAFVAVKVPLLLVATTLLTLPSFFVLNTLLGLRGDFPDVLRAVGGAQAAAALVLAALAPYVAVWYLSSGAYPEAILFNALTFTAASFAGQAILRRNYRPLIARDPRHRLLLRGWLGLYAGVGIQMGWVLRPFIGAPGEPVRFLRDEPWSNAYVVVAELAVAVLKRWAGLN
jgi:hypothetical protein